MVLTDLHRRHSLDQSYLEGVDSYTTAKALNQKLSETHLENLTNMSSFNGQNPLFAMIDADKVFAAKFSSIADGTNTADVTSRLGNLNTDISNKKLYIQFAGFVDSISGAIDDNDLIQRLLTLAAINPTEAWEKLMASEKFLNAIQKSETVQDFFFGVMSKMEKFGDAANAFSAKIVNALVSNDTFITLLDKMPLKFQDKMLDVLTKFSDDAFYLLNKSEGFVKWLSSIAQSKPLKFLSKISNTALGKVITSPWLGVVVEGGFSAFDAYNDEGSETYKDIGKSATCGFIDGIASIGPIDGALIGASIGGPWGAAIGFGAGAISQGLQSVFPNGVDNIKNWAYGVVDDVREG